MNRRKKRLIRFDLQLKVVFITLFVASFVLLVNFQLLLAALWSLSAKMVSSTRPDLLLDEMRSIIIQKFFISLGIAVPLGFCVGVLYSFRFSGPVWRFKQYFGEVIQGRWGRVCRLRKGDDLQDVCESINGAMDQLRGRLKANHELLGEVGGLLGTLEGSVTGSGAENLRRIEDWIRAEAHFYKERFEEKRTDAGAVPAKETLERVT
jgi:hypothetical protein